MKQIIPLCLTVMCSNVLLAQSTSDYNNAKDTLKIDSLARKKGITSSFYYGVYGNADLITFGYEHFIVKKKNYKITIGAGLAIRDNLVVWPLELSYLRGKKRCYMEASLGYISGYSDWEFMPFGGKKERVYQGITTLKLGFRVHFFNERLFLKAGGMLAWRSVFFNENEQRIFFYESRNYYSPATIWDGIGENIIPWWGVSTGLNL